MSDGLFPVAPGSRGPDVNADLGEGFVPWRFLVPFLFLFFMNGHVPERHPNELGRREREGGGGGCCSAWQQGWRREGEPHRVCVCVCVEEGVKAGYPINRPHLTSVAFPSWQLSFFSLLFFSSSL